MSAILAPVLFTQVSPDSTPAAGPLFGYPAGPAVQPSSANAPAPAMHLIVVGVSFQVSMDSSAAALFLPGYPAAPAAPAAQPSPGSDSAAAPAGQPSPSLQGAAASSGQPAQPPVTAPGVSAQVPAGSENAAAPSQGELSL